MSDLTATIGILTLVFIQPALYLFLKSQLVLCIAHRNLKKKKFPTSSFAKASEDRSLKAEFIPSLTRGRTSVTTLAIISAHLIPFFIVLGIEPLRTIPNFFASLCYIIPSSGFNACSGKIMDYVLYPPARFAEGVTELGYGILIFGPVLLQSIFWLVFFVKKNISLTLALIGTSCLYAATFIGLYKIDMYAPLTMLLLGFLVWFGYWIARKTKGA